MCPITDSAPQYRVFRLDDPAHQHSHAIHMGGQLLSDPLDYSHRSGDQNLDTFLSQLSPVLLGELMQSVNELRAKGCGEVVITSVSGQLRSVYRNAVDDVR